MSKVRSISGDEMAAEVPLAVVRMLAIVLYSWLRVFPCPLIRVGAHWSTRSWTRGCEEEEALVREMARVEEEIWREPRRWVF